MRTQCPILLTLLLLQLGGCSSKKAKEPPATAEAQAPESKPENVPPWRVAFSLDDNESEVFIPRPKDPDKTIPITSFVAKRARDLSLWTRIDLILADGTKTTMDQIDRDAIYALGQHEEAGVDLIAGSPEGKELSRVGPLRSLRLHTISLAERPRRIEGRSVLVIRKGDDEIEQTPSDLDERGMSLPPGEKSGAWPLLPLLGEQLPEGGDWELVVRSTRGEQVFALNDLRAGHPELYLRYNKRGELRLKAYRDGTEDAEVGLREVALLILRPSDSATPP